MVTSHQVHFCKTPRYLTSGQKSLEYMNPDSGPGLLLHWAGGNLHTGATCAPVSVQYAGVKPMDCWSSKYHANHTDPCVSQNSGSFNKSVCVIIFSPESSKRCQGHQCRCGNEESGISFGLNPWPFISLPNICVDIHFLVPPSPPSPGLRPFS